MLGRSGFRKQEVKGREPRKGKKKEKIMKKSCKIFSAVALSAVLAVGTAVPAFAATPNPLPSQDNNQANAYGDVTYDKNDLDTSANKNAGASTNVNISTYSSAYNITVPLWAPFAVDTEGGAGIAPTNYYIQNNNESTIYVTEVTWTMDNVLDWTFKYPSSGNAKANQNWVNSSGQTPKYGSFVIGLAPSATVNAGVTGDITADASYKANAQTKVSTWVPQIDGSSTNAVQKTGKASEKLGNNSNFKYWVINPKAAGATANVKTMIDLDIENTALNAPNETITKVAAITYTVSARQPV